MRKNWDEHVLRILAPFCGNIYLAYVIVEVFKVLLREAAVWTQDEDLKGLDRVKYPRKYERLDDGSRK